jgi:spore germination cell wall hydrolase CwlJ-like protein
MSLPSRPMLAQAKIHQSGAREFAVSAWASSILRPLNAKFQMIHDSLFEVVTKKVRPRRRLIGAREILILLIAFSLLALAPSMAQIAGFRTPIATQSSYVPLGDAERPEQNFAGSAFYFLDADKSYAVASNSEALAAAHGVNDALFKDVPLEDTASVSALPSLGGVAQPFMMNPASADFSRALKCLSDAIYYEAANEPDVGQRAVAQVIINRMRHPTYPNNVCGVIYQGSERRTGCQFSYACDGSMARIPSRFHWERARRVAMSALTGSVFAPVGMATHYHTAQIYPYWAPSLHFIGQIGAHRFYSWNGSAGRPSAFFRRYAGNEPFPGPKPRAWSPTQTITPLLDPLQLQKQYEREYAAARAKAETAAQSATASYTPPAPYADIVPARQRAAPSYAAPDYSKDARNRGGEANYVGEKLPETNIKPEFQNSGTWKAQPKG